MSALKKRVSRHFHFKRLSALAALMPALVLLCSGAQAEARSGSNVSNIPNVKARLLAPFNASRAKLQGSDKGGRVAQLIEQGVAALERGDASSAKDFFEQAVKIEPTS